MDRWSLEITLTVPLREIIPNRLDCRMQLIKTLILQVQTLFYFY